MAGYVEGSMAKDEFVQVRAKYHWLVWLKFYVNLLFFGGVAVACVAAGIGMYSKDKPMFALIFGAIALVTAIYILFVFLKLKLTEMACTNRRVIFKSGIVSLKTAEVKVDKIESIQIEQTFWGRILGCGNIIFSGTGTTKVEFFNVSRPWKIKTKIEEVLSESSPTKAEDDD